MLMFRHFAAPVPYTVNIAIVEIKFATSSPLEPSKPWALTAVDSVTDEDEEVETDGPSVTVEDKPD